MKRDLLEREMQVGWLLTRLLLSRKDLARALDILSDLFIMTGDEGHT